VLSFAACRQATEPGPAPASSPDAIQLPDTDGGDDSEGNPDEINPPGISGARNEALVKIFTPDGAEVYTDVESELILKSEMSMPDMIAFCLAAADEIGAEQIEIDESRAGLWVYSGIYGENLTLTIDLRDDGNSVNMLITY